MNRISSTLLLALLFVGCASTSSSEGPAALDEAWAKAFKAGDLDGVMACYAPDAVSWAPDAPEAKGEAAIRQAYREFFAANTVQDITDMDKQYRTAGNLSVSWGRSSMTAVDKATGKPVVSTGRYSSAAEKRGGKWVYIVDHSSSDPAPRKQ